MFFKLYIAIALLMSVFSIGQASKITGATKLDIAHQIFVQSPLLIVGLSMLLGALIFVGILALRETVKSKRSKLQTNN